MHPRVGREGHGKWRLLVLEDVIVDEEKILLPLVTGLKGFLISLNQARCGIARGAGGYPSSVEPENL